MFRKLLDRFRDEGGEPFQPLYSIEEIEQCGRLPIATVLAFAVDEGRTGKEQIGPGVGGILASLLRRDLIFTRVLSVTGGEDTGYLEPDGKFYDDSGLLRAYPNSTVVIAGQLKQEPESRLALKLRVVNRKASAESKNHFVARISTDQISTFMPAVAAAVCKQLGIAVKPEIVTRWRKHTLIAWHDVLRAARCWEEERVAALANLLKAGRVHPDAIVAIEDEGPERNAATWALKRAAELEPDNPQLAFLAVCANCDWSNKPVDPRFEQMLRSGLTAAPGHGKSHMVLPHLLDKTRDNTPYILAHSEVGYQLLPNNAFALNNFSSYLTQLAPQDKRISKLFSEAILQDGYNPGGYELAIHHYLQQKQPKQALRYAQKLLALCTPPINDRTLYCYQQSPRRAEELESGKFDPHTNATQIVRYCEAAVKKYS